VVAGQPVQVVVQALEQGVVRMVGRGRAVAAEEVVLAELRVGHVQDGELGDPAAGRPRGDDPAGVENLRPGAAQPLGGDRVAVPRCGAGQRRGGEQADDPADRPVPHRAAAEARLDAQGRLGGRVELQAAAPDLAAHRRLHPGAVRAGGRAGVAEHVDCPPRRWRVGRQPRRGRAGRQVGRVQHQPAEVVARDPFPRRRDPALHPRGQPRRRAAARDREERELDDDRLSGLVLGRRLAAERRVDNMRAGHDLALADQHPNADRLAVRAQQPHDEPGRQIAHHDAPQLHSPEFTEPRGSLYGDRR
jgi:hypothetical protein